MTPPRTLRRKLQKKKKAKPYRKCPKCGKRMTMDLYTDDTGTPRLWKLCIELGVVVKGERLWDCNRGSSCGYKEELFWKSPCGGMADASLTKET
jgi:hypothetical protein